MEIMKMDAGSHPDGTVRNAVQVLERGGVACLPCNGSYRLFADVTDESAVMRLLQSKRRVQKTPSLVFIDDISNLYKVVDDVEPVASALAKEFWPAPLTIRFDPNSDLPRDVVRELTKATGKLGVRVPGNQLARTVVESFGSPVYVSSANRGQKTGETSAAQVRHNFMGRIDFFLDAGDLNESASSTVIDVDKNDIEVVRSGAIAGDKIEEVAAAARS